jgi:hypothetical protein
MRYSELTPNLKTEISKIVLSNQTINVSQILHTVFKIKRQFSHSKFFLIGTNEITKSERLIGRFYALDIVDADDTLVLFESLLPNAYKYSGFVECISKDERTGKMETILIHPFTPEFNHSIKIAQSEIKTLPMAIINYNYNNNKSTVLDYISKEHWTLLEKRFRGFINVLL